MQSHHVLALVALAVLVAVNVAVCVRVARSAAYTHRQVLAQSVVVWLLPIVGALLVVVVLWSQRPQPFSKRVQGADPENWQNAQEPSHEA